MTAYMMALFLKWELQKLFRPFQHRIQNLIIIIQNNKSKQSFIQKIYNPMINNRSAISRPSTSRPSTASLNSSMVSNSRYPKCDFKKQHARQLLNLLCLSSNCKHKGPICSMCKASDHNNHIILPTRIFMQKLKNKITSPKTQIIQEKKQQENKEEKSTEKTPKIQGYSSEINKINTYFNIIETSKNEMLAMLSYTVKQIADKISQIEETIIKQSNLIMQTLQASLEAEQNLEKVVEQFIDSPPDDSQLFKHKIKTLLSVVTVKSKDNFEIGFSNQEQINAFKTKSQSFQSNIEDWLKISLQSFNDIYKLAEKKVKTQVAVKTAKFSSQMKSKSIILSGQNKIAKQTDNKLVGFALLAGTVVQQKTVAFKIHNISTNIKIGVCLKEHIKTKAYKFTQNALGHGAYLASNNSYTFSNTDAAYNMTLKGFTFQNGDIIELVYCATQIKLQKRNSTLKCKIPIKKMSQAEQKQLVYCVWLGGNGDKIEIVE